jgi:hypothetical protein
MHRDPEPYRHPRHDVKIEPCRWFCMHCNNYRQTESEIQSHVASEHFSTGVGGRPDVGVDYCTSAQVKIFIERWDHWRDREIKRYEMLLGSCVGVDDVLLEIDNG